MRRNYYNWAIGALTILLGVTSCGSNASTKNVEPTETKVDTAIVYFTKEITPESLVKIYNALGVQAQGKVAVKISTGEMGGNNYLQPSLIEPLVKSVNGTIVECNTAYAGERNSTEKHRATIAAHGFDKIAEVDIMDEDGSMSIPVKDTKWIKENLVGSHLERYDFMINLAHFKGHQMGGFGGVLKNASIGVASASGKANIHTAGKTSVVEELWTSLPEAWDQTPEGNDPFTESMAAAAQAVHDYFIAKKGIVYIDIMNKMSIDCDCSSNPAEPKIQDRGIMASLDPVAVDKACIDVVFGIHASEGDDNTDLINRINERHGTHIIEQAELDKLGTTVYKIISLD